MIKEQVINNYIDFRFSDLKRFTLTSEPHILFYRSGGILLFEVDKINGQVTISGGFHGELLYCFRTNYYDLIYLKIFAYLKKHPYLKLSVEECLE